MEYRIELILSTPIEAFVTPDGARETIEVVLDENLPDGFEVFDVKVKR